MAEWKIILLSLILIAGAAFADEVCFEDVGCFDDELECNKDNFPPWSPEEINTEFWLFTREQPVFYQVLNTSTNMIEWSNFNSARDTVVYIHGFTDNMDREWNLKLKDALLARDDFNVIFVDWRLGADIPLLYYQSLQNCRVVARQIINFINKIMEVKNVEGESFYLIGHSTGAHMVGHIAHEIPGIYRVTGLDPAGPHFDEFSDKDCKLDPTDAPFVDVIHTDGFLGSTFTHGHIDFFPNGGSDQPGCWKALLGRDVCDHLRSIRYFTESLNSGDCEFTSYPCQSWEDFENGACSSCGDDPCPIMGYDAVDGPPGVFMLETNGDEPYCIPEQEEETEEAGGWFWGW